MARRTLPALTADLKEELIKRGLQSRLRRIAQAQGAPASASAPAPPPAADLEPGAAARADIPERFYRFELHPGYRQLQLMTEGAARLGLAPPFFKAHEGIAGARTRIAGREYLNFSSYNYLGLNGHPQVSAAARAAIERYGTSVSASRAVAGERPLHRELEQALAAAYGADDAVVFVSGHATNVTLIGYLFGPRDLVLHDELIHNSTLQGIALAGAQRRPFAHNDPQSLAAALAQERRRFERVLIVVEGIYSMDGDFPDLPRLIEIKRRHRAFLMVDEAHSFGVAAHEVDIWMGTLSKALAACGGYVVGSRALVEHLKYLAPGFLYSVGMSPPVAAAALAALERLRLEPERAATLRARGARFLEAARRAGIDIGTSAGISVIPAILGSSIRAVRTSQALFERGINVQPILHPAVPEKQARLRFFMSSEHRESEIEAAVEALAATLKSDR